MTPIPASVDDLTSEWFSEALAVDVTGFEVVKAHSGTTGRARVRLHSDGAVPETLFLKLQPFDPQQREYVRMVGMGVAEASLYAEAGHDLPVRIPQVWHSAFDEADGSFVMVLEDLTASGCRFPTVDDDGVVGVAESLMDESAKLHARYWGQDLPWVRSRALGSGNEPHQQARLGRLSQIVQVAIDRFAADLPTQFRALAELFVGRPADIGRLWNEGDPTLIHGDNHIGNLFVDGPRTGFFDWAVACRAPAMRDISYVHCNSLPTEVRRDEENGLIARDRHAMAGLGVELDDQRIEEEYRLFATYSWMSAVTTAAMGSQWQAISIGQPAMIRTTQAIIDLDSLDVLQDRLGSY